MCADANGCQWEKYDNTIQNYGKKIKNKKNSREVLGNIKKQIATKKGVGKELI